MEEQTQPVKPVAVWSWDELDKKTMKAMTEFIDSLNDCLRHSQDDHLLELFENTPKSFKKGVSLKRFVKGQNSKWRLGDFDIFVSTLGYDVENIELWLGKANCLYLTSLADVYSVLQGKSMADLILTTAAVRCGDDLLINADYYSGIDEHEESDKSVVAMFGHDRPAVSFECFARLFDIDEQTALHQFATGQIKLVDYGPSKTKKLSKKENALYKDGRECDIPKPGLGFNLVRHGTHAEWHRPSTCLFTKDKTCYLIGQDEGTYFGVALAGKVKTVKDAYVDLIPKAIRKSAYQRQGEWFFVSVDAKKLPSQLESIPPIGRMYATEGILPLETGDSNQHKFSADCGIEIDGTIYLLNPRISHNDHDDTYATGWVYVVKNTALRSVSQEGVD